MAEGFEGTSFRAAIGFYTAGGLVSVCAATVPAVLGKTGALFITAAVASFSFTAFAAVASWTRTQASRRRSQESLQTRRERTRAILIKLILDTGRFISPVLEHQLKLEQSLESMLRREFERQRGSNPAEAQWNARLKVELRRQERRVRLLKRANSKRNISAEQTILTRMRR